MRIPVIACSIFLIALLAAACDSGTSSRNDPGSFPPAIDSILHKHCAIPGCHVPDEDEHLRLIHNDGGLDLTSWSGLFRGGAHGAVIVPYQSRFSDLVKHISGESSSRMPPAGYDTLSPFDVQRIIDWIDEGAPSKNGNIPYEDATQRIYVTNQVDDVISVIDAVSHLVIRIFDIGDLPAYAEIPHGVTVGNGGRYFYITMLAGVGEVFKYDAFSGEYIGKATLSKPLALAGLSKDGEKLYIASNFLVNNPNRDEGSITVLRTSDMSIRKSIPVGPNPHGVTVSRDGKFVYAMSVMSDRIYVIDSMTDSVLQTFDMADDAGLGWYAPYHIALGPAELSGKETVVFVSCSGTNEIRFFERTEDDRFFLVDSVAVGYTPIGADVTPDGQWIYVANYGDSSVSILRKDGNRYVVDRILRESQISKDEVHRFSGPLAVRISADGSFAYVTNRNKNGSVPPHHGGGGGPGFLSVIDTHTHQIVRTIELPPDAYTIDLWPK